ncbi:MAG: MgtC/SapB family protein [Minisyncoccia bacterium]
MENFLDVTTLLVISKLGLAVILGTIIGIERHLAHKTAGMRTYAMASMGSALFIIISTVIASQYQGVTNFDPLRLAAQVVSAAGFLCAGLIVIRNSDVSGLTSSAGLWVSIGIGMACGFGLFRIGIIATLFTLFILIALHTVEKYVKPYPTPQD